jgi:uncharacterized protein (UPF0261 family)
MMKGVRKVTLDLYAQGRLQGVACLGGAEGAVLGAHAMQALPIGLPKLLATPIASGKRHFGPLMGLRDVMVIHSIVDILGLNPISRTIFDNMAAALAGMAKHGHPVDLATGERYVAITMLGNTTKAVMAAKGGWLRPVWKRLSFIPMGSAARPWKSWPARACSWA